MSPAREVRLPLFSILFQVIFQHSLYNSALMSLPIYVDM